MPNSCEILLFLLAFFRRACYHKRKECDSHADPGGGRASDLGALFFTPSSLARDLFYYATRCGHYFCNHHYSFSHQSEIALEGDHNRHIMLFAVQDGAMELEIAGEPVLAAAGQIVLFDCREPYRYAASDGLEFIWLLFNG